MPSYQVSPNIAQLTESATIAASARARALKEAGRPIIDLGAGQPDQPTPAFISAAAAEAVEGGATRYTATEGIAPLRRAIAAEATRLAAGRDPVDAGQVVVSGGSKQSIFNACFCLFGPGDEVLIPTPAWTSYFEILTLSRATPVSVPGDPDRGLRASAAQIEAHATARTRGLIINSPSNPTGAIYPAEELAEILSLAARNGWWVISDEIYRRIVYERPAPSALEVATDRSRLIVASGVAKAYAMTGWRIGWAIAARPLAMSMTALQSHTTFSPAAVSQHAALSALTDPRADEAIAGMVAQFRARRDAASRILSDGGVSFVPPEGAFYLFVDARGVKGNGGVDGGTALASHLLEKHDVVVVAGTAFDAPGWIRLSYAAPDAEVAEGARRVVAAIRELQ
jgi:aspartate aminotransferase